MLWLGRLRFERIFSTKYNRRYFGSYQHNDFLNLQQLIKTNTEVTSDHLTPEIKLHLITPSCKLWHSAGTDSPFNDPYWAFYWPGGQVLSRFILDNPELFTNKCVVDVGSGCGASAIACKFSRSGHVIANDIDKVAIAAIKLNCELNSVDVELSDQDILGHYDARWDVLILGDMFYDTVFADLLHSWVPRLSSEGIDIFIGDPGRIPLINHPLKEKLRKMFQCPLPDNCLKENNGMSEGVVWRYKN